MLPQCKQHSISKLGKRDSVDLLYQVVPLTTKKAMCWLRFIQFNLMVGWRMEGTCLMILRNNTSHVAPSEGWICWIWIKYSDILPGKSKDFLLSVWKLCFFSKSHNMQWFSQEKKKYVSDTQITASSHFKSLPQSRMLPMSIGNKSFKFLFL